MDQSGAVVGIVSIVVLAWDGEMLGLRRSPLLGIVDARLSYYQRV